MLAAPDRALDEPRPLAAVALDVARPAILRELADAGRDDAYASWSLLKQKQLESLLECERDRLPKIGLVTLSSFVPFLSLDEAVAGPWAESRRP